MRSLSMLSIRTALLVGLLTLLGCAPEEPSLLASGVRHLTLRLPDGSSPVERLEAARHVVQEWRFESGAPLPTGWSLSGGELLPGTQGAGLRIRPTGPGPLLLTNPTGFPALEVNAVEVELIMKQEARVDFAWGLAGVQGGGSASLRASGEPGPQVVAGSLLQVESWKGRIDGLSLGLSPDREQPVELRSLRLVHEAYVRGFGAELDAEGRPLDGGLVRRGSEAQRAFPADLDEPLEARVQVPAGGRLSFGIARARGAPRDAFEVQVQARVDGESTWRDFPGYVVPADHPAADRWSPVEVGLEDLVGESVTLRLTAKGERPSPTPRARVLFGSPMVLGTMIEDRRPNILLVTLDTLRYDAIGPNLEAARQLGETVPLADLIHTPVLDELASTAIVFDTAYSAGNSTQPSHAAILTGVSIQDHSLFDNYGILGDGNTTLSERLRAAGYQTAAAVCQSAISMEAGFGQGFDHFVSAQATSGTDGRLAVDAARSWLRSWEGSTERPFFLWLHLFDPHTPYELPDGFLESFAATAGVPVPDPRTAEPRFPPGMPRAPELAFLAEVESEAYADYMYQVEVAYTDQLLGSLFEQLEPFRADTMTFITADHGESLGERGNYYNHRGLYPETVHVPLIVEPPGGTDARHVSERVTNRDIVPTVLSQLGLVDVARHRDLLAVAEGASSPDRRLWFEHANKFQVGCRDARYHVIVTQRVDYSFGLVPVEGDEEGRFQPVRLEKGQVQIYDWTVDPALERDLAPDEPELVALYLELLEEYRASGRPVGREARVIDAAEAAELEALGYTGD